MKYSIAFYTTASGKKPFELWLKNLRDDNAYAKVFAKLTEVKLGNLGHMRGLKDGVFEFKINYGPGYRLYFAFAAKNIILILYAGVKGTQKRDITKAKKYWLEIKLRGATHE